MARLNYLAALDARGAKPAFAQTTQFIQQRRENEIANELARMQVEQAERFNALAQDPNTTPEQFARAGRSDIATSILGAREMESDVRKPIAVSAGATLIDPTTG